MSNMFTDVLSNAGSVEQSLIGPDYEYWANINSPSEMAKPMSADPTLDAFKNDIRGIAGYAEILASGYGAASKTGKPLGNKFFLQTGGQCTDTKTNTLTDRYIYINNVPMGNIPFIPSSMGVDVSPARGLIPGIMSDLSVLNPFTIMQAFMLGANPPCQEVTMDLIDTNNNPSTGSHFVTVVDLQNMDPCWFSNPSTNPVTNIKCTEAFTNIGSTTSIKHYDTLSQIYIFSLGLILIYFIYLIMNKH